MLTDEAKETTADLPAPTKSVTYVCGGIDRKFLLKICYITSNLFFLECHSESDYYPK